MLLNIIYFISALIGFGAVAIGLGALFLPEISSKGFGIPASGEATAYVRVSGARDVFIGMIYLFLYLRGEMQTLAYVCFFTAFVSGSDFLITRRYGSKLKSYFHLGATLLVLGYGVLLLKLAA